MNNLLSLNFWLNVRPGQLMPEYQQYFIIFVVILVVLTIVFAFIQARNKKNLYGRFWTGLYYFCLTNTIIGVFLLFFIYEAIPFLSARFWFLLWVAEVLVWIFFLVKKLREIPKRKKQLEEERKYKKYIP
ncbi:hypothetical protein KAU19_02110 [Candidatus Parcubacteria bacterium]|nr:hypothetical protein [Candidatus Parcubacteria bacterium]